MGFGIGPGGRSRREQRWEQPSRPPCACRDLCVPEPVGANVGGPIGHHLRFRLLRERRRLPGGAIPPQDGPRIVRRIGRSRQAANLAPFGDVVLVALDTNVVDLVSDACSTWEHVESLEAMAPPPSFGNLQPEMEVEVRCRPTSGVHDGYTAWAYMISLGSAREAGGAHQLLAQVVMGGRASGRR